MDIEGRVVAITGGASGIGEALAYAAAEAGASHVAVVDLDGDRAAAVAERVDGSSHVVDVADEQAIVELVDTIAADHGPIDLFCSNAGFVTAAGLEESNEAINHQWDVHVMSHIYAARAVLPSMIAKGEGYLLNTASAAGLLTQIGSLSYSVTKHAAVALAEWLALSHHHQGIRVSVLCPQGVITNITDNSPGTIEPDSMLGNADRLMRSERAAAAGFLEPAQVAEICLDAIAEERFLVLPHPEVGDFHRRKADDIDRWLTGMRRLQDTLYRGGPLPGDAIAPSEG